MAHGRLEQQHYHRHARQDVLRLHAGTDSHARCVYVCCCRHLTRLVTQQKMLGTACHRYPVKLATTGPSLVRMNKCTMLPTCLAPVASKGHRVAVCLYAVVLGSARNTSPAGAYVSSCLQACTFL